MSICFPINLSEVLNKSWRQHPTRLQLYGHLPPITKTIQVRRTRHAGHCWRSKDELISDVLLWTPTHGCARVGRPARTYIQQLCEDTGCNPEDLPEAMNDREKWRETVRDIRAGGATWWWWWWPLELTCYQFFLYIVVLHSIIYFHIKNNKSVFFKKFWNLYYLILDKSETLKNSYSLERRRFQADKGNKQMIPRTNNYRRGQRRWHSASCKYTRLGLIPAT